MMNQTEIGRFIAKCRKEKKMTQAQLWRGYGGGFHRFPVDDRRGF